jgi:hypothetical protein
MDRDDVTVNVELPEGSRILAASPTEFTAVEGGARWQGTLVSDVELALVFGLP